MLFTRNKVNPYQTFLCLVEDNIDIFNQVADEFIASCGEKLSDEEFTSCYVCGMERLIDKLHQWAYEDLKKDNSKCLSRYISASENPAGHGFRFPNKEMTIGKVYLYYNYGKTGRKAHKSDCIKLERYAFSLIGKQYLNRGLIH